MCLSVLLFHARKFVATGFVPSKSLTLKVLLPGNPAEKTTFVYQQMPEQNYIITFRFQHHHHHTNQGHCYTNHDTSKPLVETWFFQHPICNQQTGDIHLTHTLLKMIALEHISGPTWSCQPLQGSQGRSKIRFPGLSHQRCRVQVAFPCQKEQLPMYPPQTLFVAQWYFFLCSCWTWYFPTKNDATATFCHFASFAKTKSMKQIMKGSVSDLSSPCFSTIIGVLGDQPDQKRRILGVFFWFQLSSLPLTPPWDGHGFNSHRWRGHVPRQWTNTLHERNYPCSPA